MPGENYIVPPLERLDRQELLSMIERKRYFDLHAPRQTGKTSALVTLRGRTELPPDGIAPPTSTSSPLRPHTTKCVPGCERSCLN